MRLRNTNPRVILNSFVFCTPQESMEVFRNLGKRKVLFRVLSPSSNCV